MPIDLPAAADFLTAHARLLDRRRYAVRFAGADPAVALAALDAYRNPDSGYGWGLEPDLRSTESQPGGALHAFEVFEDIAPATSPRAVELCGWLLEGATLPDGGMPFALPVGSPAGVMPFWAQADPDASSLHITAAVAAAAHRVARHDPAVAAHPWLARATAFCLDTIASREAPRSTLELLYSLGFLDALADSEPRAVRELERFATAIPDSGAVVVHGGIEGETIRPIEFTPFPDRPLRKVFAAQVVAADLDRLAGGQREDGGWEVDFRAYSPQAELEWRGYATVHALIVLRENGRV